MVRNTGPVLHRRLLVRLLLILVSLSLGVVALFVPLFVDFLAVGALLFHFFEAKIRSSPGHLDRLSLLLPGFGELLAARHSGHQLEVVEGLVAPLDEVALAHVFGDDASQLQIVRLNGVVDLI